MSAQDIATIERAHAAFAQGDIGLLLAQFDPGIEWHVPESLPWGGRYRGTDELPRFFGSLMEHFDEFRVDPDRLIDADDTVVDIGHFRGRAKNGTAFELPVVLVWTVRDRRPVAMTEYTDTAAMRDVINVAALH